MIKKRDRITKRFMIYDLKFKDKKGFTLVELLVGMSILVVMALMMIGTLNAIGLTNKGRDAQRKKDLNKIKIAFEEYFSDKGEFPDSNLLAQLTNGDNCKSNIFAPYLNSWPCDPNDKPYYIYVDVNKFRVITNLENKKDKNIPTGWYSRNDFSIPSLGLTTMNANYGVSSSNILWYEGYLSNYSNCNIFECLTNVSGVCNVATGGCKGNNCYYMDKDPDNNCDKNQTNCKISCCGLMCD